MIEEPEIVGKELYNYQRKAIDEIFRNINANEGKDYSLLYQLPTGGGKTVIFSEIARRFTLEKNRKVLILTHRIELSKQTSEMLFEFGVKNMVITSEVKVLPKDHDYQCFVAMIETLNNRISEEAIKMEDIGLVIVDEAHYNSFTKIFKYFRNRVMLGVTATPLSSNIKMPMYSNYDDLIVGESIPMLIHEGFLAKAVFHIYNVGLGSLKIGANGDYTVSSSERLYADSTMQIKLLRAYSEVAVGTKTLIFNNGILTSRQVYTNFKEAGYDIRHLDNTNTGKERKDILDWFHSKPDAILTSVGILTTGFDEPGIETIILNRATRSLTLYFQMIGRGSRIFGPKKEFNVIDLGNNLARFGQWDGEIDWYRIFKFPEYYLQNMVTDDQIEQAFRYVMPESLREKFNKSPDLSFDVEENYNIAVKQSKNPIEVIGQSVMHHAGMCIENSENLLEALHLSRELEFDIADRIKRYTNCIAKSTINYKRWLIEDYTARLRKEIMKAY